MPSSISNSDRKVRSLWPRIWLAAVLVIAVAVASWEAHWRSLGFRPSLTDDAMLWAISRGHASDAGPGTVALVGSSRMQMDIHRESFERTTGWSPAIQLAVVRGPARPVLRHLAEDPDFTGTVVCEVNPSLFFGDTPGFVREIDDYLTTYNEATRVDYLEQRLRMFVQGNLVTRLSRLQPRIIRNAIIFRQAPTPRYTGVIGEDRFRYTDYRRIPNLDALNRRITRDLAETRPRPLSRKAFEMRLIETEKLVDAIRTRGGEVVFVRLPSAGAVLAREEEHFERREWWDVFADRTNATAIHFRDEPALERFSPLDGDHLDGTRSILFAQRLGQLLVEAKIAPGRSVKGAGP